MLSFTSDSSEKFPPNIFAYAPVFEGVHIRICIDHVVERAHRATPFGTYLLAHVMVFLASMDRKQEGLNEAKRAHELDPTSELTNMVAVHILYLAREYDRAINQAKNTMELYPQSSGNYFWLAASYEGKGLSFQAAQAYLESRALAGAPPQELAALRSAVETSGLRGYWTQWAATARSNWAVCRIAVAYTHAGENEKALEYLDRAAREHCDSLRKLKVDQAFDKLRQGRRFQELLVRLQLQPAAATVATAPVHSALR